ncbi:MAG TPA: hypothetical protein VFI27_00915 [candidate division Zixibacteria bacterium]|nr:hypothetical protein [candidate division Zixibacteria bacterium]
MKNDDVPTDQHVWPWPEELDALIAAPDNHTLLFENESVRVLDTRIGPGRTTPVHTHCWPGALYVQSWSDFVRRDDNGNIILDSRKVDAFATPPTVLWSDALPPHTLKNVGDTEIWVISVELK